MKAGHNQAATHAASPVVAVPVSFAACYAAWLKARRGKRPGANQLAFEVRWVDRLLELKTVLRAGRWQPARTVSFVVTHPKTREIHAPDFADRVVHHLLVERLEKLYEPVFIHDSYANRQGRGSHAAVDRLQQFVRSRNGQGWYLQLDIHKEPLIKSRMTAHPVLRDGMEGVRGSEWSIPFATSTTRQTARKTSAREGCGQIARSRRCAPRHRSPGYDLRRAPSDHRDFASNAVHGGLNQRFHNFNTIHRPTLYAMLCKRLEQCERRGILPGAHALALRSLCHKLLANKVAERVCDPAAAARVPPHKRLANAASGCGLPVGNLSSQFFANVYLNALDQFVKHTLKCRHYVRYVDDFVLLAADADQLRLWQAQIDAFLANTLALRCKEAVILQPLCQGVDFLGYRVFAGHRRVRPRVVAHCRAKLRDWAARHVRTGEVGTFFNADKPLKQNSSLPLLGDNALAHLQAMLGSYWGHFAHAQSVRLRHALFEQFDWLKTLFVLHPDGQLSPRWVLQGANFAAQVAALKAGWSQAGVTTSARQNPENCRSSIVSIPPCQLHVQLAGQWIACLWCNRRLDADCLPLVRCLIQKGNRWLLLSQPEQEFDEQATCRLTASLRRQGIAYVRVNQTGWLRHGTRRREVREWFSPNAVVS